MLLTDYEDIIKNIKYRKDRYLKDLLFKTHLMFTDVSLLECLTYEIYTNGLDVVDVVHEGDNTAGMFSIIGLYDVKFGDEIRYGRIIGPTLTQNAIIAKIAEDYTVEDVTVVDNGKPDHIKIGYNNLGQNLLDKYKKNENDTFERAKLIEKVLKNNDLGIYEDIIEHNVKLMIRGIITKDIYNLYQKMLDKRIKYTKTQTSFILDESGPIINVQRQQALDKVSSNKPAKKLLCRIAKRLERDIKLPLNNYINKYESIHNAFVKKNELIEKERQEQSAPTLKR